MERSRLGLRRLADLAEHLARRRLVELHARAVVGREADRLEQPKHAETRDVGRQLRLLERERDEGDGAEVVDLVRLAVVDGGDQGGEVLKVAADELRERKLLAQQLGLRIRLSR